MSTYNEPIEMIDKSISSILQQSYKNIELIVVNDNPTRKDLDQYLSELRIKNNCIIYLKNEINIGLVGSLNRALSVAQGDYIARMDADDISDFKRLEKQLKFLTENNLDIVGSEVTLINELDEEIGSISCPSTFDRILDYYNYGSCLFHPTWLLKKSVYDALDGYRNIQACEDFDFMLRAFDMGFKAGNVTEKLLRYRVRKDGISVSLEANQKLITYYLQKNRYRIQDVSVEIINEYTSSKEFKNNLILMNRYIEAKNSFKISRKMDVIELVCLIFNKYFYINVFNSFKRKMHSS